MSASADAVSEAPFEGPLSDVTVLDLSDEATAQGARMLAELGADVVRAEDAAGDDVRSRPPFLAGADGVEQAGVERSLAHLLFNAGKRSLALDLGRPAAWGVVSRLLPSVDVVIGPLNVPVAGRPFFQALRKPERGEGAGVEGPAFVEVVFRRGAPDQVATDLIAMAAGGHITLNGTPEEPPHYPAGQLAYRQASMAAAEAAVALVSSARHGHHAGHVVISMQEAVNLTTLQTANGNYWHWHREVPSRHRPISSGAAQVSRDGKWTSFTVHPPNWDKFTDWVKQTIGDTSLQGPEWDSLPYRFEHLSDAADVVSRLCAALDRAELCREGQARGLLVMPLNDVPDLAVDPHLVARNFIHEVEDPVVGQTLRLPRTSFLSDRWASPTRRAPSLGEHTSAVLAELGGLTGEEVRALFEDGLVVGSQPTVVSPWMAGAPPARRLRPLSVSNGAGSNGLADPRQPLAGVRVVDFTWAIAGTLCTRLLADLGADVIKVESDYRTDPIRYIGVQPGEEMSYDTNGQFNDVNVNKRALTLNLNAPEGLGAVRELLATADVVTSNYTPDRLDRWGIGYAGLRAIKPDVILANMAVMGTFGPHKDWRSYGNGIVAMSGLAALTGFPGGRPIGLGTLHTDFTVPYFGALLIMSALMQRERTGEGQSLELSQFESALHLLDTELVEYLNNGVAPPRMGNRSRRFVPHGVFPGAGEDTWVAVVCRDDADWARLCALIQRPDLAVIRDRRAEEGRIEEAVSAWTRGRDHWIAAAALQAAGVPASPVETLEDLLTRDTAMRADYREMDLEVGVTAMVQEEPILWNGERLRLRRAPKWGEHTLEVLQGELGFDDARIASLAAANALW